jgi:hypothetical protein
VPRTLSRRLISTSATNGDPRVDALVVEGLDQLPLDGADQGGGQGPRALHWPPILVEVLRGIGVELVELPRADP